MGWQFSTRCSRLRGPCWREQFYSLIWRSLLSHLIDLRLYVGHHPLPEILFDDIRDLLKEIDSPYDVWLLTIFFMDYTSDLATSKNLAIFRLLWLATGTILMLLIWLEEEGKCWNLVHLPHHQAWLVFIHGWFRCVFKYLLDSIHIIQNECSKRCPSSTTILLVADWFNK